MQHRRKGFLCKTRLKRTLARKFFFKKNSKICFFRRHLVKQIHTEENLCCFLKPVFILAQLDLGGGGGGAANVCSTKK